MNRRIIRIIGLLLLLPFIMFSSKANAYRYWDPYYSDLDYYSYFPISFVLGGPPVFYPPGFYPGFYPYPIYYPYQSYYYPEAYYPGPYYSAYSYYPNDIVSVLIASVIVGTVWGGGWGYGGWYGWGWHGGYWGNNGYGWNNGYWNNHWQGWHQNWNGGNVTHTVINNPPANSTTTKPGFQHNLTTTQKTFGRHTNANANVYAPRTTRGLGGHHQANVSTTPYQTKTTSFGRHRSITANPSHPATFSRHTHYVYPSLGGHGVHSMHYQAAPVHMRAYQGGGFHGGGFNRGSFHGGGAHRH